MQARIVKAVIELRPSAWVFHPVGGPFQLPGVPDLLMCVDGLFIAFEVKFPRPGESTDHARARATPQQRRQIRLINASGGFATVVTSVKEAVEGLHRAVRKHEEVWGAKKVSGRPDGLPVVAGSGEVEE